MKKSLLTLLFACFVVCLQAAQPLNVLLITVDDMSADSLGCFGCKLAGTSPNIDRLATQGMRFNYAHVVVGNCMPSRNVMWSGRYPHNTGVEGFYQVKDAKYPHLVDLMKGAGYFTAIRGKVSHSTPYSPYAWDLDLDTMPNGEKAYIKNVASYGISTKQGIQAAKKAGKPFCLLINVSDPHKPFYAQGKKGETIPDPNKPSRVFTADEVPVPGFLFDDPVVREELSHYYSSVRRADDCVGEILHELKESGQYDNTLIMFVSDHGMPLPFAKTQVYRHSTNTPLMFIWPGVTKPGSVDNRHMVSAVDFLPTLLDIVGIPHPKGFDGRSFATLLKGGTQEGRDYVIKEYNENAGGNRDPMRAIETKDFLYIFNPWSNGKRIMATATTGTPTYRRMKELSATDPVIAARHELYQHRVVEELFNVQEDADALHNLMGQQFYSKEQKHLQDLLEAWMVKTHDPMLEVFRKRQDPAFREAYVQAEQKEADERRSNKKGKGKAAKKGMRKGVAKSNGKKADNLISWSLPETVVPGQAVVVKLEHHFPADLGEQTLQVTLKEGKSGKRVERKILKVSGEGKVEVSFKVPAQVADNTVRFAAFVGEEFTENLQYLQSNPMPAK